MRNKQSPDWDVLVFLLKFTRGSTLKVKSFLREHIHDDEETRAIADGYTIWRAGKTVFLCEEMPPDYLYHVEADDPSIQEMIAIWEEE